MMSTFIKNIGILFFLSLLVTACTNENEQSELEDSQNQENNGLPSTEANAVQDLYLYMNDSDLEHLYSRDPNSDDRLSGYIKLDRESDEILELDGGLRFRGNTARGLDKKSFNIRFEENQDFLFGSNRMNLNGMFRDPSMMREKLSWEIFAEVGHPAPRAKYFNLYINDIFEGLYVHIERVDKDLLENHNLNREGTLVRDRIRNFYDGEDFHVHSSFGFDLSAVDNDALFLEGVFDSRGDPHWGRLADLLNWVYETPAGPAFAEKFDEKMNSERFIDWLALHFIIGDMDSFGDDYWLYLDHEDPDAKWEIIPWDKNLTFGSHTRADYGVLNDYFAYEYPLVSGWDNLLFEKMLETADIKQRVDDQLLQLMEEVIPVSYVQDHVSQYLQQIEESVMVAPSDHAFQLHPQNHFGEVNDYQERLEVIETYIQLRYEYIAAQLGLNEQPEPYKASKQLDNTNHTDPIYFTGSNGYVIGSFTPTQLEGEPMVTLSVEQNDNVDGVKRTFHLLVENGSAEGTLTLFYRNDLGWPAGGNWYKDAEAVGDQSDLTLASLTNDSFETIDSEVNPYTNRVSAKLTIEGTKSYILTIP